MDGHADWKAVRDILQLDASEPLQSDVQDVDDGTVYRALAHCRGNVHKAAAYIRQWLTWRRGFDLCVVIRIHLSRILSIIS